MMTLLDYEKHRDIITKREAIVTELLTEWDATHVTVCPTWHGYDIQAGTRLIASPELGELLGRSEIRDSHGCIANWYILENRHIANLWACEVDEVN